MIMNNVARRSSFSSMSCAPFASHDMQICGLYSAAGKSPHCGFESINTVLAEAIICINHCRYCADGTRTHASNLRPPTFICPAKAKCTRSPYIQVLLASRWWELFVKWTKSEAWEKNKRQRQCVPMVPAGNVFVRRWFVGGRRYAVVSEVNFCMTWCLPSSHFCSAKYAVH